MFRFFIVFLILALSLLAESIEERIEAIKAAPPSERVVLMNALKMDIARMNEEERERALEALKIKSTKDGGRAIGVHRGFEQRREGGASADRGIQRQRGSSMGAGANRARE